jgi:4-diphosphocytidyl-2C-methyl-D-erythritol kinase
MSSEELDKIKISTNEIYKKGFMFPEVARNDFAVELFDELEIQEKNLNSNLENVDLFNSFQETAENVKKKLKEKY